MFGGDHLFCCNRTTTLPSLLVPLRCFLSVSEENKHTCNQRCIQTNSRLQKTCQVLFIKSLIMFLCFPARLYWSWIPSPHLTTAFLDGIVWQVSYRRLDDFIDATLVCLCTKVSLQLLPCYLVLAKSQGQQLALLPPKGIKCAISITGKVLNGFGRNSHR